MIYLDNGATTLQKPPSVGRAMEAALYTCGNPGRGGHRPAMRAADIVFTCRQLVAQLFGLDRLEGVVFTLNCTHALNLAIKSTLNDGGHAVISGYEHNSAVRPLEALRTRGVGYSVASWPLFDTAGTLAAIEGAITAETRCVIVSHVSNVFGFVLPLMEIDALCARRGVALIVDAAQSAGMLPLDVGKLKAASFVCMPGHKGLYGPQGTGILLCCKGDDLHSLIEGGTGSNSLELTQPGFLPDIFESGTLNVPGIAGLAEGVQFVLNRGVRAIGAHEADLTRRLARGLEAVPSVRAFSHPKGQSGVLSFVHERLPPEAVAEELGRQGICVRAGLHCATLAHRSAGTLPQGTVRASFSVFNTARQADALVKAVGELQGE